ncbi:AmmeMemoRadiSam system protein B [bacterium CG10_46_32]|nr:MAG: AmmeMemoRadiSam system protein B [bacterium CG10_46_32]PIR55886.1 MAG: AmmeMemoRadiSam system protein B [Parcubacteria group bacterium CG10_big_fil_rev_8_21_14_0_10_46_32]
MHMAVYILRLSILFAASALLAGCSIAGGDRATIVPREILAKRIAIPTQDVFYNHELFTTAIMSVPSETVESAPIRALVAPHHLLASKIIASLFASARSETIDTVIIIGPNHDDVSPSTITTAHLTYKTPLGDAATDDSLVASLSDFLGITPFVDAFAHEHSVGALIPFVRYYFPEARVVPIIFNSTATRADADRVAQWLSKNADESDLVVVSIDFSHYLTEQKADQNDELTERLMVAGNVEEIMRLNNAYVDSPPSLASVLLYAVKKGLHMAIRYRANANDFTEQTYAETTSYFGIAFTEQE